MQKKKKKFQGSGGGGGGEKKYCDGELPNYINLKSNDIRSSRWGLIPWLIS